MSIDTVNLYNEKKKLLIETSSCSEPGILNGGPDIINGIFDESYMTGTKDAGGVVPQFKKPRFIIDEVPAAVVPKQSTLELRGNIYKITKTTGKDENGYSTLWLE